MLKRLHLAGLFVAALLVLPPAPSHAQATREARITVEWQDAALSDVVNAFARFSGRTIAIARDVQPSLVTFSARDVEWRAALELMLAQQGLVARVDDAGVIHVEHRTAPRSQ
jgi:hypothetical protein